MDKISIIEKLLENDQSNPNTWYLLAVEYKAEALYSQALQAFSEALKYCDDELRKMIFIELGTLSNISGSTMNPLPEDMQTSEENRNEVIDTEEIEENEEFQMATDNIIPLKIINGGIKNSLTEKDDSLLPISFSDVGGLDKLKDIIRMKIVKPFVNPGLFNKYKKKIGGGILLYGPPGCGKTFIARATAGECNANFTSVQITDILDPYLGVSAHNINDIFENARRKKPCVLFFDEVDTIGYNRMKLSSEHMRPIIDQLLTEIEGVDSNTDKLLIMAATNMPWDVDPAFKRPGRFDKTVFIPPPDEMARTMIFKLKLAGKPIEDIQYELLAKQTELFSGADIENIVEIATENVITEILSSGNERPITTGDLLEAISQTKPSTIEWLRTIKNYVKYANQAGQYDDVDRYLLQHKKILG